MTSVCQYVMRGHCCWCGAGNHDNTKALFNSGNTRSSHNWCNVNVNNKFIECTCRHELSSALGCHLQYCANRNVFNWRLKLLSIESSGSRRYSGKLFQTDWDGRSRSGERNMDMIIIIILKLYDTTLAGARCRIKFFLRDHPFMNRFAIKLWCS